MGTITNTAFVPATPNMIRSTRNEHTNRVCYAVNVPGKVMVDGESLTMKDKPNAFKIFKKYQAQSQKQGAARVDQKAVLS